jgi:hypothetical protein
MLTAPTMGGIHIPRCGGMTQAPADVETTITPDALEINCPRRCWCGAMR